MRLVHDMARIIPARSSEHTLEALAQLEFHMIKHHEKEEDIFLPMASHILNASRDELLRKLEDFDGSRIRRKWDI